MLGKEQVPQCTNLGGRWVGGRSRGSETSPGRGRAGPAAHGGKPSGWHLSCPLVPVLRGPSHGGPSVRVSASDVGGRCKWRSEIQDIAASGEWRSTLTSPAGRESPQRGRRRLCSRGLSAVPSVAPPRERRCVRV